MLFGFIRWYMVGFGQVIHMYVWLFTLSYLYISLSWPKPFSGPTRCDWDTKTPHPPTEDLELFFPGIYKYKCSLAGHKTYLAESEGRLALIVMYNYISSSAFCHDDDLCRYSTIEWGLFFCWIDYLIRKEKFSFLPSSLVWKRGLDNGYIISS